MNRHSSWRHSAVTLLEVLLSMALLVVLTTMTYWFYASSLELRREGTIEAQKIRLARAMMDRMVREIRQASIITTEKRVGIRGLPERIWLSTIRLPDREVAKNHPNRTEYAPAESDLVKIEYKIARHPDELTEEGYELPLGLARIEIRVPRADSAQLGEGQERGRRTFGGGSGDESALQEDTRQEEQLLEGEEEGSNAGGGDADIAWEELYAPEIKYLRFCYYDGSRWWDTWEVTGESPLPQLVQITIGYEPEVPFAEEFADDAVREFCTCLNEDPEECLPQAEDRYSRTVRIPQADPLFRSRIGRETQAIASELVGGEEQ